MITYESSGGDFLRSLRADVQHYFADIKKKKTGTIHLYTKSFILLTTACVLYGTVVFYTPTTWLALILCGLLGINLALIGFNIMHDGSHGSYSEKPWVNKLAAMTADLMGASSALWRVKHTIIHHFRTNSEEDGDIQAYPFLRFLKSHRLLWFHKYQAWYACIFYALLYIGWVTLLDFKKYSMYLIYGAESEAEKMSSRDHITFWGGKMVYGFLFLYLPMSRIGVGATLLGYGVMGATCGLFLSIVFQLAHMFEGTGFPVVDPETEKVEGTWAAWQVKTTTDFGTDSKIWFWLLGGLNFQVEHHLFPKISHVHYPALKAIVVANCVKYGLQYNNKTVVQAVATHFRFLNQRGRFV